MKWINKVDLVGENSGSNKTFYIRFFENVVKNNKMVKMTISKYLKDKFDKSENQEIAYAQFGLDENKKLYIKFSNDINGLPLKNNKNEWKANIFVGDIKEVMKENGIELVLKTRLQLVEVEGEENLFEVILPTIETNTTKQTTTKNDKAKPSTTRNATNSDKSLVTNK